MKSILLASALALIASTDAAFAGGEGGYNPSQFAGVPPDLTMARRRECKPRLSRSISGIRPSRPPVLSRPARMWPALRSSGTGVDRTSVPGGSGTAPGMLQHALCGSCPRVWCRRRFWVGLGCHTKR
jgi:hypothetical protein